jgi:integrase
VATLKLTKTSVEAISPGPQDVYGWDTELPRFGVRVTPAKSRIYLVQYRAKPAPGLPPKTRRITIGDHGGVWTLDLARGEAKRILASVDLGRDPFADRASDRTARHLAQVAEAERKLEEAARQRDNFKAVAERYIELRLSDTRSGAETARLIRFDAEPAWASRHIGDLTRADVADLLDRISKRSPAVSRATYAALRGLFSWCLDRDLIRASPCHSVTAPARPEARDRVLGDSEIRAVWRACGDLNYPFGPLIRLLLLTGQRRAEVGGMTWAEIDLKAAIWRIPKERAKNGKAHEVDLSPQAVAILESIHRISPYVFPGRNAPARKTLRSTGVVEQCVSGFSATKRRLDELVDVGWMNLDPKPDRVVLPWRLHDLRRTAATGMAGMGFAPHVVERVLNHVSGAQSGLVGVYQRHEYRVERTAALTAWGSRVEAIVNGGEGESNVRQLRA